MKRNILYLFSSCTLISFLIYTSVSYASGWQMGLASYFSSQFKLLPVYAVLLLLSICVNVFSSAILISLSVAILGDISKIKEINTGEPLGFYDLLTASQAKHLIGYVDVNLMLGVVAFLGYATFLVWHRYRYKKVMMRNYRFVPGIFGLLLLVVCLYQYVISSNVTQKMISQILSDCFNLGYVGWQMNLDVEKNGLPFHLVFTSKKDQIKKYSLTEMRAFESQLESYQNRFISPSASALPKKIIYVLCEACWDTHPNGESVFSSLLAQGFYETNMVSPVYGGGTANTEFEVLTGLPSSRLSGYVYQEYRHDITEKPLTVPSEFKRLGYRTLAAHNFYRNFYHRDEIYPKFAFDKFVDIQDMNYTGDASFPPDSVLFDSIKSRLGSASENVFVSAVTVSTHGPYKENGDGGYSEYEDKLERAVKAIKAFVDYLDAQNTSYLMVIYGDHKPAMSKYFYDKKILPESVFVQTGDSNKDFVFHPDSTSQQNIIGDVPVLIKVTNMSDGGKFIASQLKNKPIFCLSPITNTLLGTEIDPSFEMMAAKCGHPLKDYGGYRSFYPDQLYYRNLFSVRIGTNQIKKQPVPLAGFSGT